MGAGHWRPGGLLGSPFNVKWRFSAPAGGVEESKLCLFSVIMPVKCVSSVSPRFHYRRVAFCFLPLAAILEFSSQMLIFSENTFTDLPRNNDFPAIWISLNPVKFTHKINHHEPSLVVHAY
jgi:hypothetical protein